LALKAPFVICLAKGGKHLLGEHGLRAARALWTERAVVLLAIRHAARALKHLLRAVVLKVSRALSAK